MCAAENFARNIERADALYAARGANANVASAVEILQAAARDNTIAPVGLYEILWRTGRAHFFLGQEATNRAAARKAHAAGVRACRRAIALDVLRVEAWFWLGVNLALQAQNENKLKALFDARRARRALIRAATIDESYHAAGALRARARLESKLPSILGGSRQRARELFERAVALAPHNSVTRIYYAEFLFAINERAAARRQLEILRAAPPDEFWQFERARDERRAHELLSRIRDS